MKSVFCAVRIGSLNKAIWASPLKGYLLTYLLHGAESFLRS